MTCASSVALGAYVLGALGDEDRHALDTHLRDCLSCRDEIVYLAPLPGLLNRVRTDDADPPAPESPGERPRSRRRTRLLAHAGVALCLVVGGVVAGRVAPESTPTTVLTQTERTGSAQATAALTRRPWGTMIELRLSDLTKEAKCQLVVHGKDGSREVTGSWSVASYAGAGDSVEIPAATSIAIDDITSLDVRTSEGEQLVHLQARR